MRDFWISVVRSIVPAAVTAVVGWLAQWGITVDSTGIGGLEAALFAFGYSAYYGAVRLLEIHVKPWFGWLLGHPAKPKYVPSEVKNFTDMGPVPTSETAK
jgi:hypothetical protein